MNDFYVAEFPDQVHGTSILGMSPNCPYVGPGALTLVARVWGKAANYYTNGAAYRPTVFPNGKCSVISVKMYIHISYSAFFKCDKDYKRFVYIYIDVVVSMLAVHAGDWG